MFCFICLSIDSIFIFISRQLRGKYRNRVRPRAINYLSRRDISPARCHLHALSAHFSPSPLAPSPLRALQGEAAHQELPSCLAPEVSYTLHFPSWLLLLSSVHWRRALSQKHQTRSLSETRLSLGDRQIEGFKYCRNWAFRNIFQSLKHKKKVK